MPGRAVLACLPFRVLAGPLRITGSKQLSREPRKQAQKLTTLKASGDPEAGPTPRPSSIFCLSAHLGDPRTPAPSVCLSTLPSASPPALLSAPPCQPSSPSAHVSVFLCLSPSPSLEVPEAWSNSPRPLQQGLTHGFSGAGAADGCGCPPVCLGRGWEGREQVRMRHCRPSEENSLPESTQCPWLSGVVEQR